MLSMRALGARTILALATTLCSTLALAANTVTYTGTGTYEATRLLMPLASGGAAIMITATTTATVAPSEPGFLFGQCTGLAHVSDQGTTTTDVYCTFEETGEDGFDMHAKLVDGEGGVDIVGGSGKWKGAGGNGTLKRKYVKGNRGSYEYEFKISTP